MAWLTAIHRAPSQSSLVCHREEYNGAIAPVCEVTVGLALRGSAPPLAQQWLRRDASTYADGDISLRWDLPVETDISRGRHREAALAVRAFKGARARRRYSRVTLYGVSLACTGARQTDAPQVFSS